MSARPGASIFDRSSSEASTGGDAAPGFRRFTSLVGVVLVVLGVAVLAGWAMGSVALRGLVPGLATMKANTAIALGLAGWSLLTLSSPAPSAARRRTASLAAIAVSLMGALPLLEYASGRSLGLDEALFEDPGDGFAPPGRMAPPTAGAFLLLGLGFCLAFRGRILLAQVFALGTLGLGAVAVAGYLYSIEGLFRVASFTGMALHTALAFVAAGLALLFARPDEGLVSVITGRNLGGVLARKLLPVAILGPLLLGGAIRGGHRLGLYGPELQLPVVVLATIALLAGLVWMNAGFLSWFDHDREDAFRRLSEREERERRLLASSIMGVAITDRAGRILEANQALLEMVGYDPRAILGRTLDSLSQAEPGSLGRHGLREAVETGRSAPRERTFLHRDGTRVPVLVGLVLLDPERGEVVAYAADLREQKTAEAKAARSESRYRRLFEQDLAGALRTTGDGTIIDCNAAFARTFGFAGPEAARGTKARAFDPDGQQSDDLRGRLVAEGVVEGVELELRRVDGKPVRVLANLAAFMGADGRLAEVDGLLIDVTAQREVEAQLRQAQRVESVGRLAGGVAHDFNNLLAVVTGYAELLRGQLRPRDPRLRYVGEIRKATDRAAALTRQLLAFSRQQVLRPRVLDLDELLAGMAGMLRRLIGEHIELVVRGAPELGRVEADPGQMEQVVMNLALNARDAMPNGGRLVIETQNAVVEEDYARRRPGSRAGHHVMLTVSDTGHGMDAATQARIFEPFFTTKEVGKGTGLGLATTYGIVKQSGGSIWVYSEPGLGSVFKVYLPRVGPAPTSTEGRAAEVEDGPPPSGGETILVVEDEASLQAMMVESLRSFGYKVWASTDPKEALRLAKKRRSRIDLLVTDVVMPAMNGRELAQKVRDTRPDLRVLYVSGYTDDTTLLQGISRDELFLLQKPFGPDRLARRVREVLDRPEAAGSPPAPDA